MIELKILRLHAQNIEKKISHEFIYIFIQFAFKASIEKRKCMFPIWKMSNAKWLNIINCLSKEIWWMREREMVDKPADDGLEKLVALPPVMLAILLDIDVDMGWFDGDAVDCVNPITFTPFTWPAFVEPKLSFKTDGCDCAPGCVCWCLSAFVRRFATGGSRVFRLGCSTGSTRRRFFGNFDRACAKHQQEKDVSQKPRNIKQNTENVTNHDTDVSYEYK